MGVPRHSLALNGGTIRNRSGTANADLRHRAATRGIPASVPRGCKPKAGGAVFLVGNSTRDKGNTDWTYATHKAQSFTTGGAATLKQALVFGSNWNASTRVSIYSDSSGQPGSNLRTGRAHFHGGYGLYVTVEDALAGWSLGDRMQVRTGGAWRQHPSAGAMRLEVLGTPTAAATAVDPPTVSGEPAVSEAGSDGEWGPGETVEVTLTFSEAVTVDTTGGTPTVGISLGNTQARSAAYLRGSGTTNLIFGYTLTDADGTHTSMVVTHNSLALNGGTIRSEATSVDAELAHNGKAVQASPAQDNEPKGSGKQPANTPATGAPAITGTAQVGQTLTADTSSIADADGTANATFTYQWIAETADIAGATEFSYTLTSSEQGQTIKVRVTFTDDNGSQEILTGAATAAVRALTPFTAEFRNVPEHHDGAMAFKFELYFNKVAVTSWRTVVGGILGVTGGEVTKARRLDPNGADRNKRWEVTVKPIQAGDITITLPVRDCAEANAVCANEQPLARAVSATVAQQEQQVQPALTARTSQVPGSHDGNNSFTFELHFSEEFYLSYKTLRDYAFTVTGGEVVKARRLNPPSSVGWEITVQPDGDGTVAIVLPIPTHCAPAGAICTEDPIARFYWSGTVVDSYPALPLARASCQAVPHIFPPAARPPSPPVSSRYPAHPSIGCANRGRRG